MEIFPFKIPFYSLQILSAISFPNMINGSLMHKQITAMKHFDNSLFSK